MEAQTLEGDTKHDLKHIATPLPLSLPNSPTHDFSFTISLHPPPNSPTSQSPNKASFVVDLAPADDIFYGGHLLPLHFLSHPNIPLHNTKGDLHRDKSKTNIEERVKVSKTLYSLFSLPKQRKNSESNHDGHKEEETKKMKKWKGLDVLKKYANIVENILFRGEKSKSELRRRPYSFSGRSNGRDSGDGWKGKKVQYSAPVSMRTSPTNSGLLLASPAKFSTSDGSSMEELQSAIQAAIAHCKNSVAFNQQN